MHSKYTRLSIFLPICSGIIQLFAVLFTIIQRFDIEDPLIHKASIQTPIEYFYAKSPSNINYSNFKRFDSIEIFPEISIDGKKSLNWLNKSLYVSLVLEYKTKNNKKAQVIIWDSLLTKDKPKINYFGPTNFLIEPVEFNKIDLNSFNFSIKWNHMPKIGLIKITGKFPIVYDSGKILEKLNLIHQDHLINAKFPITKDNSINLKFPLNRDNRKIIITHN